MGTNATIRAHIEALFARADEHDAAAEQIRPGDGSDDYMLDGFDDVENDAIATGLDERAAELREFGRRLGAELCILDVESSASRQHFIETGRYLALAVAIETARHCGHDACAQRRTCGIL
jgi:hypothetical protein